MNINVERWLLFNL